MKRYIIENDIGKRITFDWEDDLTPPNDSDFEEVFKQAQTFKPEPAPKPEYKVPFVSGLPEQQKILPTVTEEITAPNQPYQTFEQPKVELPRQITKGAMSKTTGGYGILETPRQPQISTQEFPEQPITPMPESEVAKFSRTQTQPYIPGQLSVPTFGTESRESESTARMYAGGITRRAGEKLQQVGPDIQPEVIERGRQLAESIGLTPDKIKGFGTVPTKLSNALPENWSDEDKQAAYSYGISVLQGKQKALGAKEEKFGKTQVTKAFEVDPAWLKADRIRDDITKLEKTDPGIVRSWKKGDLGLGIDQKVFDVAMSGDEDAFNQIANVKTDYQNTYMKMTDEEGKKGWVEKNVHAVAEMLPGMTKGAALSAIPVVGTALGQSYWARQGGGDIIYQATKRGVPLKDALAYGIGGGIVYAAIESSQVGKLSTLNPFLEGVLTNKVASFLISRPLETLDESLEEGAQQIITDLAVMNAMKAAGITVDQKKEFENALKDGFMAFKQSLVPMGAIGLIGTVHGGVKLARQPKGGSYAEGTGINPKEASPKEGPGGGAGGQVRVRNDEKARLEAEARKARSAAVVSNLSDAEVKQILLRAKIPKADISKLTLDEQAEIADRELFRQKQAEKAAKIEPSPYQQQQPTDESRATGEAVAKKYGFSFKEAIAGDRDKGGVQLSFNDPVTGNDVTVSAGNADAEVARFAEKSRMERPHAVSQNPDTDRMLRMYVTTGKTETILGKATHEKLVQVFDQVAPEDIAEVAGISPVEAREAIGDIRALQKTTLSEKVRQTLAPALFYGQTVEETVKGIQQPRDKGGEVMFSREEKPHIAIYNGKRVVMDYAPKEKQFKVAAQRISDNGAEGIVITPQGKYFHVSQKFRTAKPVTKEQAEKITGMAVTEEPTKNEEQFVRASTKKEDHIDSAKRAGFNSIPDKAGYEKVYKPYGEQGAGYYYSKKTEPTQRDIFGGETPVSEIERETAQRKERAAVEEKTVARKGGEAPLAGLPMFENQNIEGSQQTLQLSREEKSVLDQLLNPKEGYEDITITDNPAKGFLLPDGNYLGVAGVSDDHRVINGMVKYPGEDETAYGFQSKKMFRIMRDSGIIRFIPESNSFQIVKEPTRDQVRTIGNYIKENGKAEVEFGENRPSHTYTEDNLFELEEDLNGGVKFQREERSMDLETARNTATDNGLEYVTSTPAKGGPFYTFRDPRTGTEFHARTTEEVRRATGDLVDRIAPKGTTRAGEGVRYQLEDIGDRELQERTTQREADFKRLSEEGLLKDSPELIAYEELLKKQMAFFEKNGYTYNEETKQYDKDTPENVSRYWSSLGRDERTTPQEDAGYAPFSKTSEASREEPPAEVKFSREEEPVTYRESLRGKEGIPSEQDENYRRAREDIEFFGKKPKGISDKARRELEQSGYQIPEGGMEPVRYDFAEKETETEGGVPVSDREAVYPQAGDQGEVPKKVTREEPDIIYDTGTEADKAHGQAIADQLKNVRFNGVWKGFRSKDGKLHSDPQLTFTLYDNQGKGGTSILAPLDATAGHVAKRRLETLRGDVKYQIDEPRKSADPFFSPTLKAVQGLKQERGTGEQMFAMITKTPGVKEAEWKWMGLDDFLKGNIGDEYSDEPLWHGTTKTGLKGKPQISRGDLTVGKGMTAIQGRDVFEGFYVTNDKKYAAMYAAGGKTEGRIVPVYIKKDAKTVDLSDDIVSQEVLGATSLARSPLSSLKKPTKSFPFQEEFNEYVHSEINDVRDKSGKEPLSDSRWNNIKEDYNPSSESYNAEGNAPEYLENFLRSKGYDVVKMQRETIILNPEVAWIGDKPKGQKIFTKKEIEEFVAQNQVRVEEVKKGETPAKLKWHSESMPGGLRGQTTNDNQYKITQLVNGKFRLDGPNGLQTFHDDIIMAQERARVDADKTDTKYSTYQLPGGDNYREVLLMLPVKNKELGKIWEMYDKNGTLIGKPLGGATEKEAIDQWNMYYGQERGIGVKAVRRNAEFDKIDYQSSHWDEPNIIAHVRLDDRTGPNGEKVLFVEEIQSDWAREAREKGIYDPNEEPGFNLEDESLERFGKQFNEITNEQRKEIQDAEKKWIKGMTGVSNQPFLKNWEELVMKRVLRMAAEEGYDRVAWINGEQTAARYDLSKQVDRVTVTKKGDKYSVVALPKDSGESQELGDFAAKDLSSAIGKDLAEKATTELEDGNTKNYSGLDLKIGGEWASNLYDRMIPKFLEKYGKKWGTKVEPYRFNEILENQMSIAITPEMRESVLYEGQPMFQKEGQREPTSLRREEPQALRETPGRNLPTKDREAGNTVPENVSAVVSLTRAIERDFGQELPEGSITAVDAPQEEAYQVADRLISEEFGRTPVWFKVSREAEDSGVRIGGARMSNRPSDVFINTKTKKPVIVTAVHETMHVMQESNPDLYYPVLETMMAEATPEFEAYRQRMIDKGYTDKEVMDEMVAEISGERFTDPEFLKALHERSPDAFRAFVDTLRRVIQQIKDWIRKSGIEHAGKYFVDLNRVDKQLQDSLIEMRRRGQPEMKMTAQRETRFSREEKEPAYKVIDKRAARVTKDELPAIYEEAKTFDSKTAAERLKKRFGIKKQSLALARYIGRTVSGTLLEISPVIRDALQKQVNRVMIDTAKANRRVLPLVKAISKIPEEDAKVFDIAAKNADSDKINELAGKYGFRAELDEYRKVMDEIVARAKEAGYETGYLKDYFPRMPKDRDAYRNYIRGLPEWGQIEEAMREKSKAVGHDLNEDEQAEFLNLYIRGYGRKMSGTPGQLKERTIKYLDNEMNALLEDTRLAIPLYVEGMIKKIARKEFFGNKKETDELYINDIDQSIGDYVAEQIRQKHLDPVKQDQLVGLLKSYFNYKPTNRTIAVFKNLGYAASMGSGFSSMFSQMQDAAFGFYTAPGSEAGAIIRSLLGKNEISIKDLGIDDIAAEFRDPGKLAQFVDKLLRGVGLKYGDSLFKNAFLNANLKKYRAMAKSGKINKDLRKDLDNIFGAEADEVIADLKAGVNSDNVKLLMLNQISKFQPTTLLQVPQAYLDAPRGRIAYALKTYQINQFNAIIDEAIRAMNGAKDLKAFGRAFGRIAGITAMLMAAGVGTDRLKDFLFRRQCTWGQYTVDNILKLMFISRYVTWQAREQGLYSAIVKLVAPPMSWMDYIGKDINKAISKPEDFKLKDMESIRILPVVGQEFYWWTGGGHEKQLKQAVRKSEPKKFDRELNKREAKADKTYAKGDTVKARELQQKAVEYREENIPKVREYYEKELKKEMPRNYNYIIQNTRTDTIVDPKKRYKAMQMFKKMTPGQQALVAKYKRELDKEPE
jgi:hypothetical protein